MSRTGARKSADTPSFSRPTRRPATPRSGDGDTTASAGNSEDVNRATGRRSLRRVISAPMGSTRALTGQFNDPCNYLG